MQQIALHTAPGFDESHSPDVDSGCEPATDHVFLSAITLSTYVFYCFCGGGGTEGFPGVV